MQVSRGANLVAYFDLAQLRRRPAAQAQTADTLSWQAWEGSARLVGLDPLDDASGVATALFVGPCGATGMFVLASLSGASDAALARIRAAVAAQPTPGAWRTVAGGSCAVITFEDEEVGVTLTGDGRVLLRSTPSGEA